MIVVDEQHMMMMFHLVFTSSRFGFSVDSLFRKNFVVLSKFPMRYIGLQIKKSVCSMHVNSTGN